MNHENLSLRELGWSSHFQEHFTAHADQHLLPGRVTAEHRGAFVVGTEQGDLLAEVTGRLRHQATGRGDLPAVGDWVALQRLPERRAMIETVLPRRTKFSRKVAWAETEEQVLAANVDVVFLVTALTRDLNLRRIERYLTLAWESGASPVIVLNKSDLCDNVPLAVAEVESVALGVPMHVTSAVSNDGIEELRGYLGEGRTIALLGSSGVGKSTLINCLAGEEVLRTAELRADGRGRHTTSHRELIPLTSGGLLLDTPGMRELQLWDASDGIGEAFSDVAELAAECRFSDCRHEREPGCAVLAAEQGGTLPPGRLRSYRKLQRELHALTIRQDKRALAQERRKRRAFAREVRANAKKRPR